MPYQSALTDKNQEMRGSNTGDNDSQMLGALVLLVLMMLFTHRLGRYQFPAVFLVRIDTVDQVFKLRAVDYRVTPIDMRDHMPWLTAV